MRFFKTEVWSYAVLLIILFAIASLAVMAVMNHIEEYVPAEQILTVSTLIWSLTLGFMLIAGAFGLWAIKFSGEIESRRRLSRFISAMDYLADPVIAVDRRGRITGANPAAARTLAVRAHDERLLTEVLPTLTDDNFSAILKAAEPVEVELSAPSGGLERILRLRAQPADDLVIVQISDVTKMNARRIQSMYMARLQLIGQLARGVTYDLTNLLGAISGHASLLARIPPGSIESRQSVDAILRSSEQGISIAQRLLELAQPGVAGPTATRSTGEHIRNAVAAIRESLPEQWKIEEDVEESLPPVGIGGIQVEQMILNLALHAAERIGTIGRLRISAGRPSASRAMFNVGDKYACVVLVSASPSPDDSDMPGGQDSAPIDGEPGIIESVVRSMIEESGGNLFSMRGPYGSVIHRLTLSRPIPETSLHTGDGAIPEAVAQIVAGWRLLLAVPARKCDRMASTMTDAKIQVFRAHDMVSALAEIEKQGVLDAIVMDKTLMGTEVSGIVRAVTRLQPEAGVVVIDEDAQSRIDQSCNAVFVPDPTDGPRLFSALIEARNLAMRRRQQQGRHSPA